MYKAVKKSRFSTLIIGWGEELQHTVIDRFEITHSNRRHETDGSLTRIKPGAFKEDWDLITEHILGLQYNIEGMKAKMPIYLTACDSGGEDGVTDNAYSYYSRLKKEGLHRRFILVKGKGGIAINADLIKETFLDNTKRKNRKAKVFGDIPLQLLNSNKLKDIVFNSLQRDKPGPNFCLFPDWLPVSFFDELTYEVRGIDGKWTQTG